MKTKQSSSKGNTYFHNPGAFGLTGERKLMATKKKAASTSAKKKTSGKRRTHRNPGVVGQAVNLATTALTVGFVNTGINLLTGFLPVPQAGWVGLLSKFAIAYGVKTFLPKTKFVSQQTSDILAVLIAATAVSNAIQPFADSVFARVLPSTAAPQQIANGDGMADVYAFPQNTFEGVYAFPQPFEN